MKNVIESSSNKTLCYINYGKHPIMPNIQKLGERFQLVATARMKYAHFVTKSIAIIYGM